MMANSGRADLLTAGEVEAEGSRATVKAIEKMEFLDYSDCGSDWHREIDPRALMPACPRCGSEDR